MIEGYPETHAEPLPRLKHGSWAEAELLKKWDPGDEGYPDSLTIEEMPVEALRMKRAPSFRAVLHHKINIIKKAFGPKEGAFKIGTNSRQFGRWANGHNSPKNYNVFLAIDRVYQLSLETILLEKMKGKPCTD